MRLDYTKEELLNFLDNSEEYYELTDEAKETLDIFNGIVKLNSEKDIVMNLTKGMLKSYYYIIQMEEQEEFEICARLVRLIENEIGETKRLLETYYTLRLTKQEFENLKMGALKQTKQYYEIWNTLANI